MNIKMDEIYLYEKSFRNKINIYQKMLMKNLN